MATVKNHSRDWVTMKLEIRLPYNTDVEKVRKIIKKAGATLKEHPEHGPKFILPLKSQGVNRIEESALIIRVKFTCKPGDQWVIRRVAYDEIREKLSAAGIVFAHREVRVHIPEHPISDEEAANTEETANTEKAAAPSLKNSPPKAPKENILDTTGLQRAAAATASAAVLAEEMARSHDYDESGSDL